MKRTEIAVHAMQGLLAGRGGHGIIGEMIAAESFRIADIMLARESQTKAPRPEPIKVGDIVASPYSGGVDQLLEAIDPDNTKYPYRIDGYWWACVYRTSDGAIFGPGCNLLETSP